MNKQRRSTQWIVWLCALLLNCFIQIEATDQDDKYQVTHRDDYFSKEFEISVNQQFVARVEKQNGSFLSTRTYYYCYDPLETYMGEGICTWSIGPADAFVDIYIYNEKRECEGKIWPDLEYDYDVFFNDRGEIIKQDEQYSSLFDIIFETFLYDLNLQRRG